jgi:hypothetical protein
MRDDEASEDLASKVVELKKMMDELDVLRQVAHDAYTRAAEELRLESERQARPARAHPYAADEAGGRPRT